MVIKNDQLNWLNILENDYINDLQIIDDLPAEVDIIKNVQQQIIKLANRAFIIFTI